MHFSWSQPSYFASVRGSSRTRLDGSCSSTRKKKVLRFWLVFANLTQALQRFSMNIDRSRPKLMQSERPVDYGMEPRRRLGELRSSSISGYSRQRYFYIVLVLARAFKHLANGQVSQDFVSAKKLHQLICDLNRNQCNHLLRSNRFCASRSFERNRWITGHWSSGYPVVRIHDPRCAYGGQNRSQANAFLELGQHGYRTRHCCRPHCYLR